MKNSQSNKRKMAAAVLAGLVLTGLVGASAASLGGIRNASLGADSQNVASCDTDGVDVSYQTTFVAGPPNGTFDVDAVTVGDVDGSCVGLAYEINLLNNANVAIGKASGTVPTLGGSALDTFDATVTPVSPATTVNAEVVTGIAIVISG